MEEFYRQFVRKESPSRILYYFSINFQQSDVEIDPINTLSFAYSISRNIKFEKLLSSRFESRRACPRSVFNRWNGGISNRWRFRSIGIRQRRDASRLVTPCGRVAISFEFVSSPAAAISDCSNQGIDVQIESRRRRLSLLKRNSRNSLA